MFVIHHICVVLRSSVQHISSSNYPKVMHKPKYTYTLIISIGVWLDEDQRTTNHKETCFKIDRTMSLSLINYSTLNSEHNNQKNLHIQKIINKHALLTIRMTK
jgi:hypothetical protein